MRIDPAIGRWLIDGNNVMGSRPDGWWRDRPGAMARLAAEVSRWAATIDRPVILVFDGAPVAAVGAAANDELRLRFAGTGAQNAADDLLVDQARSGDIVVTADRGLVARLADGVQVIGPSSLLAKLRAASTR